MYSGALLLGDPSLLMRAEWALVLQNLTSNDWVLLTKVLIQSFKDNQPFDDFFSLIITYKAYADFVLTYRNSKWSISQFLFQDVFVDSFVNNCDWLFNEFRQTHTIGIFDGLSTDNR